MSDDPRKLDGYVGFANLPNQVHRKSVKRGFEFTMMAVGESGLGKSTLINSLFQTDLYQEREYPTAQERIEKTVKVSSTTVEIEEKGVKLRLTVVDSPGFGDAVNNEGCWEEIETYVDSKFQEYLDNESRVNRGNKTADNRVHACLYFVPPNGHGLRPVDISFMKRLHTKVNIIPIISKADTLTADECKKLKNKILEDIEEYQINVYKVPLDEEDEDDYKENLAIQEVMPFAVIGSTTVLEVNGKKFRGRQYPWGTISVQDPEHSDFVKLRNFIIRTHYVDLKETTESLYENFRSFKLLNLGLGAEGENPLRSLEAVREKREQSLSNADGQMEAAFEQKFKEKEANLLKEEDELKAKTREMEEKLEAQKKEYEEMLQKMKALEAEKLAASSKDKKKK